MESAAGSTDNTREEGTPSLARAMQEGEVAGLESIQNYVASHTDEGGIDATTSDGKTALMIACDRGQEDIVRFLLESGANPNVSSPKSGETPLHVICLNRHDREYIAEETRLKIVQTLLQHGATFRVNGAGLSPVHVAALSRFASVVEFLISQQCSGSGIPEADKITSLEMLGFSNCMNTIYDNGYDTLCKVISQRCHISEIGADPELEAIFQCTEKYSLADINAIKDDKRAMKIQWFLIGDRIIPAGAKGVYLFRPLAKFACECMKHDEATRGYNIFKYLMSSESHSKAVLGTVMEGISHFFEDYTQDTKVVTQGCEIVNEYRDVIQQVSNSSLIEHGPQLLRSFGQLLFDIAYNVSELELLESVIKTAEKVITKVRAAFSPSDLDKFKAGSLTYHILWKQAEAYCEEMFYGGLHMPSLNRVKRALCKLFRYDDVTYVGDKNDTMLHVVLYSLNYERDDKSLLVKLARILIRHGCPVNKVKDQHGLTPVNVLAMMKEDNLFNSDDEEYINELTDLLSPTTSITTLEELAARVIVQNKIPYHGFLPESICEMIDG